VNKRNVQEVSTALSSFASGSDHEFWSGSVSLLDSRAFDQSRILGPRQITDLYLLALAAVNGGRLVTFDEGINLLAVPFSKPENLCVI
jgi:predicted nucleic acid-binding protein